MRPNASDRFKIHYLSDSHEIEAHTFIESLLGYAEVLEEINKQLGTGQHIEVRITALSGGSFTVNIVLACSTAWEQIRSLFSEENSKAAGSFIEVLTKLFELRKVFGKEKVEPIASDETSVTLEKPDGNLMVLDKFTLNLYNCNVQVNNGLDHAVMPVYNSSTLDGFELLNEDDSTFFAAENKSTLQRMVSDSSATPIADGAPVRVRRTLNLTVGAFDFDAKNKSRFEYRSKVLWALIIDKDFWSRAYRGLESMDPGDILEAEVDSIETPVDNGESYQYSDHEIVRVLQHQKTIQTKLLGHTDVATD